MTLSNRLRHYANHEEDSVAGRVERHAPLVKKIALHLLARLPDSVQLDDLMQAGMIGLLEAAQKYEAGKGATFETYAGIRIRGAIVDEIRRGDWVPRSVHRNARKVSEAIRVVEARTGSEADDRAVAAELGMSINEYHQCLHDTAGGRLFSLDELSEEGEAPIESDDLPDNPLVDLTSGAFRASLAAAINELPEREKLILSLYYQEELNLKEIGAVIGVSEGRVSQLLSQSAARLRSRLQGWSAEDAGY